MVCGKILGDIGVIEAFGKVESLSGEPNLEVMAIQTNEGETN